MTIVYTGDGKGKTTAALGLALRAFGGGEKVLILQFIKGAQISGELEALKLLPIEIRQCGLGFTNQGEISAHKSAAANALKIAQDEIISGKWNLIILDEINYAVKFGLIGEAEMLNLLKICPANLDLVFTGRNATEKLIEAADLVTEMKLIKHPYQRGIQARRGIEF